MNQYLYKVMSIIIIAFLIVGTVTIQGFNVKKNQKELGSMNTEILNGEYDIVVPDDFPTIQEAIDYAEFGYVIFVRSGTYNENPQVGKMISLIGEDPITTIIDGGNQGDVILLENDGIVISNFTIRNSGNSDSGIHLSSHYNSISNNIISNNYFGIKLYPSTGNIIENNQINNNEFIGIFLKHSHQNSIKHNIIKNNGDDGIKINMSSLSNSISNNKISMNENDGLSISQTSFGSSIIENEISMNSNIGIEISEGCDNNHIYNNNLIDNGILNAFDSSNNLWYSNNTGNYWSDYDGEDANDDGIGDIPYDIPGGENQDILPLIEPYETGDGNKPLIQIIEPSTEYVRGTIMIKCSVTDPDNDDITKVEIQVDDEGWKDAIFEGDKWYYIWDTTKPGVNEGNHIILARAKDTKNFTSNPDSKIVLVDNTPPTVDIVYPLENYVHIMNTPKFEIGMTIAIGKINIIADPDDSYSGIDEVKIEFGRSSKTLTKKPWIWNHEQKLFGLKQLKVTAKDNAGNEASEELSIFKIL